MTAEEFRRAVDEAMPGSSYYVLRTLEDLVAVQTPAVYNFDRVKRFLAHLWLGLPPPQNPAKSKPPPSAECPCGLQRADCEYHRG